MTGVSSTIGATAAPASARGAAAGSNGAGREFDDLLAGARAEQPREQAERPSRPDRARRTDRADKPDRPGKPDRAEQAEKTADDGTVSFEDGTRTDGQGAQVAAQATDQQAAAQPAQPTQPTQLAQTQAQALQAAQAAQAAQVHPGAAGAAEDVSGTGTGTDTGSVDGVQAVAAGAVQLAGQPVMAGPGADPTGQAGGQVPTQAAAPTPGAQPGPGTTGAPVPDQTAQAQAAGQAAGQAVQAGQALQGTGRVASADELRARRVDGTGRTGTVGQADQTQSTPVPVLPTGDRVAVDLANANPVAVQVQAPNPSQLADAAAALRAGVPGATAGTPGSSDDAGTAPVGGADAAAATAPTSVAAQIAAQQAGAQPGGQLGATTPVGQAMTTPATVPQPQQPVSDQVAQQLNKHITGVRRLSDGTHSTIIRLSPEQLGDVTVKLDVKGGDVHLEMIAGPQALSALQNDLNNLRDQLAQSGLDLGDVAFSQPDGSGQQQAAQDAAENARNAAEARNAARGDATRQGGTRVAERTLSTPNAGVMTADGRIDVRV